MSEFETIRYTKDSGIARIILNRPDKLNAINLKMFDEIIQAVDMVEQDDEVKVAVLEGSGKCFSAGADLEMVYFIYGGGSGKKGERRPSQRSRLHRDRKLLETIRRLVYCWKPTIAKVHGHCIGVGMYIMVACDLAFAADDASLGHSEQRLTFGGSTFVLLNEMLQIGPKKARELLLTGMLISGKEAERIDLINHAVPLKSLEKEVLRYAQAICLMPRDAIAVGKAHTHLCYETLGFSASIAQGYVGHTMATNIRFEDDEYNFLRGRREKGARQAFHERDARWQELGF